MNTIPLTRGHVAIVDESDYARVMAAGPWHAVVSNRTVYARRHLYGRERVDRTMEKLHTFLTGWPLVDHINGDGLDNRRSNLRQATSAQNAANARMHRDNRSGFKGVSWSTAQGSWRFDIMVKGQRSYRGGFKTPEEAALAYDAAALAAWGPYAKINFPHVAA